MAHSLGLKTDMPRRCRASRSTFPREVLAWRKPTCRTSAARRTKRALGFDILSKARTVGKDGDRWWGSPPRISIGLINSHYILSPRTHGERFSSQAVCCCVYEYILGCARNCEKAVRHSHSTSETVGDRDLPMRILMQCAVHTSTRMYSYVGQQGTAWDSLGQLKTLSSLKTRQSETPTFDRSCDTVIMTGIRRSGQQASGSDKAAQGCSWLLLMRA